MKTLAIVLALSFSTASPAWGGATDAFECRAANPIVPMLTTVRTEEDRRWSTRSFTYDAQGQRVLGLPAKFLSYLRQRNGETNLDEFNYTAVVEADLNLVRWLFERASPDMRCSRNGAGYSCLQVGTSGLGYALGYNKVRNVSIYSTSDDADLDHASGIVITCGWMEKPVP